jgi:hypothetical protein
MEVYFKLTVGWIRCDVCSFVKFTYTIFVLFCSGKKRKTINPLSHSGQISFGCCFYSGILHPVAFGINSCV